MTRLNIEGEIVWDVDRRFIRRLGIDEHRFHKRFGMPVAGTGKLLDRAVGHRIADLGTGRILEIVGRSRGAAVRERIHVVAIDRQVLRVPQGCAVDPAHDKY